MEDFKYLYFNSDSNTKIYLNDLEKLKVFYYKVCNKNYLLNFKKYKKKQNKKQNKNNL